VTHTCPWSFLEHMVGQPLTLLCYDTWHG
jgi:hypothetical protein